MVGNDPAGLAVVRFPAEVDVSCASLVGAELAAAIASGAPLVIADLSLTTFCDSSGVTMLATAWRLACARRVELRLVVASDPVRRIVELTGLDTLIPVFGGLAAAQAAEPQGRRPA